MSSRLADLSRGRDNNLNLLRFLAASAVVMTHSLAFYGQATRFDPVYLLFGVGSGDLAVNVFFVVSGFLITRSWLSKRDILGFAWARATRIYPALWASSLAFVLVSGAFFSPLAIDEFLSLRTSLTYVLKNSTMLWGAQLDLPHSVEGAEEAFNVPLWTLPHELQMYALVAVFGVIGILDKRWFVGIIILVSFTLWVLGDKDILELTVSRFRLMFHFFVGAAFHLYAKQIDLSRRVPLVCVLILAAGSQMVGEADQKFILALCTPFLAFWFGYVPRGRIRLFNRLGDYSYGLYILAYPIQLSIFGLWSGWLGAFGHFGFAYFLSLMFAIVSWHSLESKALGAPLPTWLVPIKCRIDKHFPRFNSGFVQKQPDPDQQKT